MKKNQGLTKRVLLVLLAVLTMFSLLCLSASAEETTPNYLTFTAEEASTITFSFASGTAEYNLNNVGWAAFTSGTEISLAAGETVQYMGTNVKTSSSKHFTMTGKVAASGSVTSLTDGNGGDENVTLASSCYAYMFKGCTALTVAPALPATTLAEGCYRYMFSGCTALTAAPSLPATTLAQSCYCEMFSGCTSLTAAPSLPATTLAQSCYCEMFSGCTSLTVAPALSATTLAKTCYQYMFQKCTSLVTAPELPAETLADSCYTGMFANCTSLATAPALPAETLAASCYTEMFANCTSLATAPALPAETLADSCYKGMFAGCTSLATAPELPAETLAQSCYLNMFKGCTGLREAPTLPATTLASSCYSSMFSGCTSLATAPELPATTLAEGCYYCMFNKCASLATVPELPATTLANNCYYGMFKGCTKLTSPADLSHVTTLADNCCQNMYNGCSEMIVNTTSQDGYEKHWIVNATEEATNWNKDMFTGTKGTCNGAPALNTTYYIEGYEPNYLTFTAEEANSTVKLSGWFSGSDVMTRTSTDNGATWSEWTAYTADTVITLTNVGDKIQWKGNNIVVGNADHFRPFIMTGKIAASGSVTSLTDSNGGNKNVTLQDYCYSGMFAGCFASLTKAPELPATKLSCYCYYNMFHNCTALVKAPELPAKELTEACYTYIFWNCTSLTEAPELPAETLADYCYAYMFSDCTSLKEAPELPAKELTYCCYMNMFDGCTSLTKVPELPAKTLTDYCYLHMFSGCTSLEETPELPAKELAYCCYGHMFSGCTSLTLTEVPELPAETLADYCYSGMFSGCTGLTSPADLSHVTTLADYCCQNMYNGCTNMKVYTEPHVHYAKKWVATSAAADATDWSKDMFAGTSGNFTGAPVRNNTYYIEGDLTAVDEVPATVNADGVKAHYEDTDGVKYLLNDDNETYSTATDEELKLHYAGEPVHERDTNTETEHYFYIDTYCVNCKKLLSEEKVELEFVAEVSATVNAAGTKEYYKDNDGNKYTWDGTAFVAAGDLTIAQLAVTFVPEVPATVNADGVKAHYEDEAGNKYLLNEDGVTYRAATDAELVIAKLAVTAVAEVPATVNADGVKAHYEDESGNKYLLNEDGVTYRAATDAELVIAKLAVTAVAEVPATVNADGVKAHYEDEAGNKYLLNEDGVTYRAATDAELVIAKLAVTAVDEVPATVNADGVKAHYVDVNGNKYLLNEDGVTYRTATDAELVIAKLAVTAVDEVPATVNADGVKAHYEDESGNKYLLNEDGVTYRAATDAELVIAKLAVTAVAEVPATVNADGVKAHYEDEAGNKYLLNEDGITYREAADDELRLHYAGEPVHERDTNTATEHYFYLDTYCAHCEKELLKEEKVNLEFVPQVDATVDATGTRAYYKDNDGNKYTWNGTAFVAAGDLTIAKLTVTAVPETAATVNDYGVKAHFEDEYGRKYLPEEDGVTYKKATDEELRIEKIAVVFVPEVPATTEKDGVKAHYEDAAGNKYLKDDNGIYNPVTDEELVLHYAGEPVHERDTNTATEHYFYLDTYCVNCNKLLNEEKVNLTYVPEKAATETKDGKAAHYKDKDGNEYQFEDGKFVRKDAEIYEKTGSSSSGCKCDFFRKLIQWIINLFKSIGKLFGC